MAKRTTNLPNGLQVGDNALTLKLLSAEPSGAIYSNGNTVANIVGSGLTHGLLWLESDGIHYDVAGTETIVPSAATGGDDSLDTAYSSGHTITQDNGAIVLNDSDAGTAETLSINKTGASSGNVIDIDISAVHTGDALDITYSGAATGDAIDINMGTAVAGSALSINLTGARTDDGIKIDDDSTSDSPMFDINVSGNRTGDIFSIVTATSTVDGDIFNVDLDTNLAGHFAYIDAGASTRTADIIKCKFDGDGNVSMLNLDSTNTGSGSLIDIDINSEGSGDALNITYATSANTGDAISVVMDTNVGGSALVVTAAGDRTDDLFKIDDSSTGSGAIFDINMSGNYEGNIFDIACNTAMVAGDIFSVDMDTNLDGSFLDIDCGAKTRTANLIDVKHDGDGNVNVLNIASTNTGTADILALDINSAGSGSALGITYATSANTGDAIDVVMDTNVGGSAITISAAGDRTDDLIKIDDASTGSGEIMDINITGAYESNVIDISQGATTVASEMFALSLSSGTRTSPVFNIDDAGTSSGAIFDIDYAAIATGNVMEVNYAAAATGDVLVVNMTNNVAGTVMALTGAGNRTDDLIQIDDSSAGTGQIFDINMSGVYTGNVLDVTYATGAATGNCIDLNMGTNVAGMAISIGSAATGVTGEGSCLDIAHTGNLAAGADVVRISSTGSISSTSNLLELVQATGAGTAGANCLYINATGTNVEAIKVDAGTVVFDETLTVTGATTLTGATTVTAALTATAGCQSAAVARTATATGETTGQIAAGTKFVDLTAADANVVVGLPTCVLGNIIYIMKNTSEGFEIRPKVADKATTTLNGGDCSSDEEVAIPADSMARCICTKGGVSGNWIISEIDADGTIDAGGTPD